MLKKLLPLALAALCAAGNFACEKKKPELAPGQLSDEEKTKLKTNALKAYEKIVSDYPDSPHAAEAKQRANALKPPGGK